MLSLVGHGSGFTDGVAGGESFAQIWADLADVLGAGRQGDQGEDQGDDEKTPHVLYSLPR